MESNKGISLRELARRTGRAVSGLHRLAAVGRLPRLANGRFNEADCRAALGNVEPRARRGPRVKQQPAPIATKVDAAEAVTLVATLLREEGMPAAALDYTAVKAAEAIVKTRHAALLLEAERGKLIDAAEAEREFFTLFRQVRDRWQNWVPRIAPTLAARLGVDQVTLAVALEELVRQELTEQATPTLWATSHEEGKDYV
jgi:uncharacterized protein with von Willebrand factor type A (vWA) domain